MATTRHDDTKGDEKNGGNGEQLDESGARSFAVFLRKLADGEAELQASEELHALAKAVQAQARAQVRTVTGRLTLAIKLDGDEDGVVTVTYAIECKEPKPRRPASTFWFDRNAHIVDENPKQKKLPFQDVSRGARVAPGAPDEGRTV